MDVCSETVSMVSITWLLLFKRVTPCTADLGFFGWSSGPILTSTLVIIRLQLMIIDSGYKWRNQESSDHNTGFDKFSVLINVHAVTVLSRVGQNLGRSGLSNRKLDWHATDSPSIMSVSFFHEKCLPPLDKDMLNKLGQVPHALMHRE